MCECAIRAQVEFYPGENKWRKNVNDASFLERLLIWLELIIWEPPFQLSQKGLKLARGSPANQMGEVFVGGAISYQIARERNMSGDIRNEYS